MITSLPAAYQKILLGSRRILVLLHVIVLHAYCVFFSFSTQLVPTVEETDECRGVEIPSSADGSPARCAGETARVRITRTRMETNMRCYEKDLEPLCAPLNCRFEDRGSECMETEKDVEVTLSTETCQLCRRRQVEMIVQKKVCHQFVDADCGRAASAGGGGRWVRRCQGEKKGRTPRQEEEEEENDDLFSPLAKIFDMTAGPVRELFRTSGGGAKVEEDDRKEDGDNGLEEEDDDVGEISPVNRLVVLNDREIMDGQSRETSKEVEEEEEKKNAKKNDEPLRIVDGSVFVVTGFPVQQSVEEFLFEKEEKE